MFQIKKLIPTGVSSYWKTFVIILTPIFLLPLPVFIGGTEARTGYGVLIIVAYWLTSAMPIAITSLLPIVLFPLMNIMSTSQVCSSYIKEANIIFFGGVVMALAVEKSKLHRRLALKVMLIVGSNPRWLMLGFMAVGTLLSMWISNSGVVAMLIPVVDAVADELFPESYLATKVIETHPNQSVVVFMNQENEQSAGAKRNEVPQEIKQRIKVAFLLSVCYAANIGGIGTLIGSGAPLAFQGILEELYGTETGLNFAGWMIIGTPVALLTTLLGWVWLQIYFNGCFKSAHVVQKSMCDKKDLKSSIRNHYKKLGSITFNEIAVMSLFTLLILLWFFKDPKFMPGWKDAFPKDYKIGDATVAIAVVILAFILPANPRFCFSGKPGGVECRSSPALLDWAYVQQKFEWSALFLMGGGYVVSEASKVSGLSLSIGNSLSSLATLPPFAVMFITCFLASMVTELASNTAVTSILLPIVAKIAEVIQVNPLYLMIPVTISCCHTFMLPIGSPPNAMVSSAGKISPGQMMKAGAVMNVIALIVLCAVMEAIGVAVFDLHAPDMPSWVYGPNQSIPHQAINHTWGSNLHNNLGLSSVY